MFEYMFLVNQPISVKKNPPPSPTYFLMSGFPNKSSFEHVAGVESKKILQILPSSTEPQILHHIQWTLRATHREDGGLIAFVGSSLGWVFFVVRCRGRKTKREHRGGL